MAPVLGPCAAQGGGIARRACCGTGSTARSVVAGAFKRQNNNQQRGPGFVDLPPLPPSEGGRLPVNAPPPPQQQPGGAPPPLPPPPQQQPGGGGGGYLDPYSDPFGPYVEPAGAPGFIDPLPPYPPPGRGGGGGGFYRRGGQQQQQQGGGGGGFQVYDDPAIWSMPPPSQNGGRGRGGQRGGPPGGAGFAGFTGFADDAAADMLLQDLEGYGGYGGFPMNDRWNMDEEEVVEVEDRTPKYVNGKRVLVNREIQASQVRVQDAQKQELGVMATDAALALAAEDGLDVVLIAEGGDAPVVRLVQFGKYKFELERAAKQKQKSSKGTETKEVRLRPVTEPHDFEVKVKAAKGFLSKGAKVKLTMQFSGREMRFKDQGKEMMLKLIEELSSCSKMDAPLSLRPSNFSVTLSPLK